MNKQSAPPVKEKKFEDKSKSLTIEKFLKRFYAGAKYSGADSYSGLGRNSLTIFKYIDENSRDYAIPAYNKESADAQIEKILKKKKLMLLAPDIIKEDNSMTEEYKQYTLREDEMTL